MQLLLKPQTLTKEAFKKFGEVVSIENNDSKTINNGYAQNILNYVLWIQMKKRQSNSSYLCGKKKKISLSYQNVGKTSVFLPNFYAKKF